MILLIFLINDTNQNQYLQSMIKVDQTFAEEVLVQRIHTQQGKEKEINYFQLGEYRYRDTHATYHNIRLYRSFSSERVGEVFLLKRIVVEDPIFADELSKNQLRVVGSPSKQIRDTILKCQYHWKDNGKHYLAFENPAYGTLSQFLQQTQEIEQLSDVQIAYILKGILLSLRNLHKENIYHQNLKLSNIAICENFDIKLHDLSFSNYKGFSDHSNYKQPLTARYIIQSRRNRRDEGENDIQAFGIILYYLLHGVFPNQKSKGRGEKKSKIFLELENIWRELYEGSQQITIEKILKYSVFQTNQSQDRQLRQKLLKKYSQYREDLIEHKKWGRKADKTLIGLSQKQLQIARGDLKIEVSKVIRKKQSLSVILSNRKVIEIKNKQIKAQNSSSKKQVESKEFPQDEFKELNCTVSRYGIIKDAIFLRLSNNLICISFSQAGKSHKDINDQLLMILNYSHNSPSLIKLVRNGKEREFKNFEEGLAQESRIMTYVKAVFQNMLEHSSISA